MACITKMISVAILFLWYMQFRAYLIAMITSTYFSSFLWSLPDTILKKYSSTVATIFTGIASAALFGHKLTMNFILGISIVFISMHQVIGLKQMHNEKVGMKKKCFWLTLFPTFSSFSHRLQKSKNLKMKWWNWWMCRMTWGLWLSFNCEIIVYPQKWCWCSELSRSKDSFIDMAAGANEEVST